jgi:UDP-N-acetylmuramate--alanine ligase
VLVAPVYEAGESPIEGYDAESLVASIRRHGHRSVSLLDSLESLPDVIRAQAKPGAMVVCLGAGDITRYAGDLASKLETAG